VQTEKKLNRFLNYAQSVLCCRMQARRIERFNACALSPRTIRTGIYLMLIDLHAHAPHPEYYDQHPYWGPAFESQPDGDIKLRVVLPILIPSHVDTKNHLPKTHVSGEILMFSDYYVSPTVPLLRRRPIGSAADDDDNPSGSGRR